MKPRYYQQIAINRTIEAVAKGQERILLVMATGTGKTYTAFQIIHRLWKSGRKKRILFFTYRNSFNRKRWLKIGDFPKTNTIQARKILIQIYGKIIVILLCFL